MNNKPKIYSGSSTTSTSPSVKTVKFGDKEHLVVSPQEFKSLKRELAHAKKSISILQNDLQSLRNMVKQMKNKAQQQQPQQQYSQHNHQNSSSAWKL